jgi:hypothetical protein
LVGAYVYRFALTRIEDFPICRIIVTFLIFAMSCFPVLAQQVADSAFSPPIRHPAYAAGKGPVMAIDEAHHNFHTAMGRYFAFANLLKRDGHRVKPVSQIFDAEALKGVDILVIANALAERNQVRDSGATEWSLPTPSAFTENEIAAVREWVFNGGSLLLIADHMPFPGCNEALAAAFAIRLANGFARNAAGEMDFTYCNRDGSLVDHPILRGRNSTERVDSVRAFTGAAIQPDSGLVPLLRLKPNITLLMPSVAWEFSPQTPSLDISGWYQGAIKDLGKGRIAVFGEAAMFTAQLAGPNRVPVGMNSPQAPQNAQFLLNTMHWLSGLLN